MQRTGQGCVWTGAGTRRLWATHRCWGQERRRIAGLGKERRGDVLSLGALTCREECTPVPFSVAGGPARWTVAARSPAQGNSQTGPRPGSERRWAGQLKQADKDRTIPDLKNARNYLP